MYTSRPTAQGDSPHGALFNKYPSGQTIINIMNCDLLNSFKVLQIICQVIACFFINRKTTPTTPAISQNRHYPADKIYHHSNTNHRLCQIAFLKLFNLCCHSVGFLFEFENTKYRDVSLGDELSSGNDLPTEKVSQATLQIIPERLCD